VERRRVHLDLDRAEALPRISTYHAVEFSKTAPPEGLPTKKASRAEALQKSIPPYQLRSKGFSSCVAGELVRAQPFPAADA
jgi:hypothetical protein